MLLLAALVCTLTIDNGYASGPCSGNVAAPTPTPTPAPTPTPTPAPPAPASGGVYMPMKIGGTNNFPAVTGDTVLIYPIPSTWPDGTPVIAAQVAFASSPGRNPVGATYEVSFSPTPGDFTYYTSLQAKVSGYTPCGIVWGPDFSLIFSQTDSNVSVCKIDGRQWYMNYRVINCPAGQTCGQTFYVPKS